MLGFPLFNANWIAGAIDPMPQLLLYSNLLLTIVCMPVMLIHDVFLYKF